MPINILAIKNGLVVLDNSLDSLVHRHFADRGTIDEHEYAWFVSGEDKGKPVSLDVFNAEGELTVSTDTNVDLKQHLEAFEKWYAIKGRNVSTEYLRDHRWYSGRPVDFIGDFESVDAFDIYHADDFDFFSLNWSDYSSQTDNYNLDHEVTLQIYYDNANSFPDPENLEPLLKVFPHVLRNDAEMETRYDLVMDVVKYISSPRAYRDSYDAFLRCSNETVKKYFEDI